MEMISEQYYNGNQDTFRKDDDHLDMHHNALHVIILKLYLMQNSGGYFFFHNYSGRSRVPHRFIGPVYDPFG